MDHSPRPFVSVSEQFPFWLLGLKSSMVLTLHFPGIRNAEALRNLATINGAPNALITKAVTHSLPPSTTVVELPLPAYTLNSHLRVNSLTVPVGFKTHFARQGWGLRSLNPDELGIAFGLPH
jgi:hypothetical protein